MTHDVFNAQVHVFRFYADGTESRSSPYGGAAENANVNVDVSSGDVQIHLRVGIQENGAGSASGAATDDWGVQCTSSVSGAFTVTGSSTRVKADTGSSLTDGAATTNRATNGITDGGGTFVAGEQEETNGVIEDHQLTADNFTEHVYAFLVVAADVVNAETLDFAITLNGSTTASITNSVTPRITITKTVDTSDVESIAANSHLGQFWMPKALSTMIPSGMRFMPEAAEASAGMDATYIAYAGNGATATDTYTFTNHGIGAAHADRVVVVAVALESVDISSVTIGGVAATLAVTVTDSGSGMRQALYYRAVASGTTATVVVTATAATANGCSIASFRVITPNATPTDSDSTTGTSLSTVTCPAKGVIIGASSIHIHGNTCTWSGLTEVFDESLAFRQAHSGGMLTSLTETTPTITVTWTGGDANLVAAAWGP